MKNLFLTPMAATLAIIAAGCASEKPGSKVIEPVDFSQVILTDNFWAPRLDVHKSATIPVCISQIEEQTGRMSNFDKVAAGCGEHEGFFFDDSDVYKALEGFAYSLIQHPDPELEAKCDDWIARIAAAQQPDGYLNTYFTLARPDDRFTDMDKHELYCAGHMTEAAIAYYKATGKRTFLDVAQRMIDYCMSVMGPDGKDWVPGHEEIELALVKLFRVTGEKKYLDFASWLLEERGHGHGVYCNQVNTTETCRIFYQDNVPVAEITDICGHAVRAMYLYCGMADVACYTQNQAYIDALNRLWDDVVNRNMYITGGIGQSSRNEGITEDYDLPNSTAYCETCASVGMILWNSRMNQMSGDAKYADVMERCLYNGALAGMSISGDEFFYVNPLEANATHRRKAWYGCACCPSQICRFLPSVGGYIYGTSKDAIWVNLYAGSSVNLAESGKKVTLTQETDYPWDGVVKITVCDATKDDIMLRVPGWCHNITFAIDGNATEPEIINGYAKLEGKWKAGSIITVNMEMPVEAVAADARVKEDVGKRAICRGPVVYCAEETDNPDFDAVASSAKDAFTPESCPDLLGGIVRITSDTGLILVPYYSWANRTPGRMKVWIDYTE